MPTEMNHLSLANHNHDLLTELLPKIHRFPDWIQTVACYKALHIIEAVFACENPSYHGTDHSDREQRLKRTKRYSKIYTHYRPLISASMVARYLGESHMKPDEVFDVILMHHLAQVEKSALQFVRNPNILITVDSSDFVFPSASIPLA